MVNKKNHATSHGSLFLCPKQAGFSITNISTVISALQKIDLIAKKIQPDSTENIFFTGIKYLDHIAYMGCAPAIKFEASPNDQIDDKNFCHIKIHQYKNAQLFYNQKPLITPLCPHCKKPAKNWLDNKNSSAIKCSQCETTSPIENFNWRKMAGHAQLFIEISDIFPKEAIPQPTLLEKLASITKTEWQHFYRCQ